MMGSEGNVRMSDNIFGSAALKELNFSFNLKRIEEIVFVPGKN